MLRLLVFLMLLVVSAQSAAAQNSHLEPGNVNKDCPNCQQLEQEISDQRVTPPTVSKIVARQYAYFIPSLLVTNTDSQKIKQVTWQATYIHAASEETIATYTFVEKRTIAPGKGLTLKQHVFIPLAQLLSHPRVITVNAGSDAENPKVRQLIAIKAIKYADGTTKIPNAAEDNPR